MRVLILNADYEPFLMWLYGRTPGLEHADYRTQQQVRIASLFGVADFYSSNLRELGHEAWDVHVNNPAMQSAWAREHGSDANPRQRLRWHGGRAIELLRGSSGPRSAAGAAARVLRPRSRANDALHLVLRDQIEELRPDVIWNQAMDWVSSRFLLAVRPHVETIVGQVAAPLPDRFDARPYDLVLSSLPNFVQRFRAVGVAAAYQPLAFEPRVLSQVPATEPDVELSFIGSVSEAHGRRTALLEALCDRTPLRIWGPVSTGLSPSSPIRRRHAGVVWGRHMYRLLRRSRLTLNAHIDVAAGHANNMRLFEATGVGTPLLTDRQHDLHRLFADDEVASYDSIDGCVARIEELLGDPDRLRALGSRGQARTLRDHTYAQRAEEFVQLVSAHG